MKNIKIIIVFIVYFFAAENIIAQQPQTEWIQRYNSPGNFNEDLVDMVLDKFGNIYLTGNGNNPSDIITLKYNPSGILLWARTYNGPTNREDEAVKIAVDDSGFVYVAGETFNFIEFNNYLTIKYSSKGDIVWIRELENVDSTGDIPNDMVLDDSSNIYITGSGSHCELCPSSYLTVKYDKDGNLKWKKFFNNSGGYSEYANSIDLSMTKRLFLTGRSSEIGGLFITTTLIYNSLGDTLGISRYSNSIGSKVLSDFSNNNYVGGFHRENNQDDIFINKYDSIGNLLWSRIYNTNNTFYRHDYLSWMVLDKEKRNIYVTGNSEFNGQIGWEFLLLKYNQNGDSIWKKGYSPTFNSNNASTHMTTDKFNNIYITGSADYNTLYYRFLTVKYDSAGSFLWSANYLNFLFANHYARRVLIDSSNSVYVAGTSYSNTNGTNDITLIKYSQITSINQVPNKYLDFKLNQNYPNPFNPVTIINYDLPVSSEISLKIYNISGKEIMTLVNETKNAGSYNIVFDGSDLSSGIYYYRIEAGNFVAVRKMLLIK